jgi:hypothetical protein
MMSYCLSLEKIIVNSSIPRWQDNWMNFRKENDNLCLAKFETQISMRNITQNLISTHLRFKSYEFMFTKSHSSRYFQQYQECTLISHLFVFFFSHNHSTLNNSCIVSLKIESIEVHLFSFKGFPTTPSAWDAPPLCGRSQLDKLN